MNTLHIEHPITDYLTWKRAFDGFAPLREKSGVRGHAVRRPVDDPHYILIDLDFETEEEAVQFGETLRTRVWAVPANSPGLAGEPITRILTTEETSTAAGSLA